MEDNIAVVCCSYALSRRFARKIDRILFFCPLSFKTGLMKLNASSAFVDEGGIAVALLYFKRLERDLPAGDGFTTDLLL